MIFNGKIKYSIIFYNRRINKMHNKSINYENMSSIFEKDGSTLNETLINRSSMLSDITQQNRY